MNPAQRKALQDLVTIDQATKIIDRGIEALTGVEESTGTFDELQTLSARLEEEHIRAAAHAVKVFRSSVSEPKPPPTPIPGS